MTGRRQTSWLLTNLATAVNSNSWSLLLRTSWIVNFTIVNLSTYREGKKKVIKDFPRRDPITPEDIQKISAIISSSAFSSNIGDFVQSTSTHMNSSFLSTQTRAWKKRNLNSSLSLQRVASPADILRRASHIPSWGRNAWCTPKNVCGGGYTKGSSRILPAWPVYGACNSVYGRFCKNL